MPRSSFRSTLGAILALVAIAAPSHAVTLPAGTIELQVGSSFSHTTYSADGEELTFTSLGFDVRGGDFVNDNLELGGGLTADYTSVDFGGFGSSSATVLGVIGDLTWNFTTEGRIVPFIGTSIGLRFYSGDGYEDSDPTIVVPVLRGGIRQMVGESASVNFGVQYAHEINGLGVADVGGNEFALTVGMSVFPRIGR